LGAQVALRGAPEEEEAPRGAPEEEEEEEGVGPPAFPAQAPVAAAMSPSIFARSFSRFAFHSSKKSVVAEVGLALNPPVAMLVVLVVLVVVLLLLLAVVSPKRVGREKSAQTGSTSVNFTRGYAQLYASPDGTAFPTKSGGGSWVLGRRRRRRKREK